MRGGMEAVYDDVPVRLGFGQFAPMQPARRPMFSARARAKLAGESLTTAEAGHSRIRTIFADPGFGGFILDFGVARMRDKRTTRDGKILADRYFERLSDSFSSRRLQV
jgi:hypothetical protein